MSGLRDIKRRIKTVKNIQQITKAMEMVAATKVKKAQAKALSARPYANQIESVLKHISKDLREEVRNEPLLAIRPVNNQGLLIITSDKGLCGSYNTNIIRHAVEKIGKCREAGLTIKSWIVGNKGVNFLKRTCGHIMGVRTKLPAIPDYMDAVTLAQSIVETFTNGEIDSLTIIYAKFVSMIRYNITEQHLLPIVPIESEGPSAEHIFEPSAASLVSPILKRYVETEIYRALLESAASELSSRMTSMHSATENAEEIASILTLKYNKARQASITKEILEVVSGAEAFKI